jgi:hypothetical protein
MAKKMLPYSVKKTVGLRAVIRYFEDKITGDEFVQVMNGEVKLGRRTRKFRVSGPRSTRKDDVMEGRRVGCQRAKQTRGLARSLRTREDKKRLPTSPLVGR